MNVLYVLLQLYAFVVLARLFLGFLTIPPGSALEPVAAAIHAVTEPPLALIRSVVPPLRLGAVGLDLSATLLVLGLLLLASFVRGRA